MDSLPIIFNISCRQAKQVKYSKQGIPFDQTTFYPTPFRCRYSSGSQHISGRSHSIDPERSEFWIGLAGIIFDTFPEYHDPLYCLVIIWP